MTVGQQSLICSSTRKYDMRKSLTTIVAISLTICSLTGCGGQAESSAPDLEQTSQGIIGGTLSWDRPEIVEVYLERPQGIGQMSYFCSGTLIAPRVVLTAANCISAHPVAVTVWTAAGGPSNGGRVVEIYQVEATYANPEWSRNGGEDHEGSSYYWDVGLVELSSAVPSKVAKPRGMGNADPPNGTNMTMWGYSSSTGRDYRPESGFGAKHNRVFRWPDRTYVAWGGDSGGPVIREDTGQVTRVIYASTNPDQPLPHFDYNAPLGANWDWIQKTLDHIECPRCR